MKKDYHICYREGKNGAKIPGDAIPPPVAPPKQPGEALFHSGKWTVWRIDSVPTLYEYRPFNVRVTEKDRPSIHHYDFVKVGQLAMVGIECGMPIELLNEAKCAADFCVHGLTV